MTLYKFEIRWSQNVQNTWELYAVKKSLSIYQLITHSLIC